MSKYSKQSFTVDSHKLQEQVSDRLYSLIESSGKLPLIPDILRDELVNGATEQVIEEQAQNMNHGILDPVNIDDVLVNEISFVCRKSRGTEEKNWCALFKRGGRRD